MLTIEARQSQYDFEPMDALELGDVLSRGTDCFSVVQCVECKFEEDATVLTVCEFCGQSVCRDCLDKHDSKCQLEEGS